jgi:hypothetical protein
MAAASSVALVGCLIVAISAFAGDGGRPKIRFNAADQAAARAALIRLADLHPLGRRLGPVRLPDLTPLTCPNYNPKTSDLVITGAAEAVLAEPRIVLASRATVLQTARMVRLDWQRSTVNAPGLISCLRSSLAKDIGSGKIMSFKRIAFPSIAPCAAAFRAVIRSSVQGAPDSVAEIVGLCRGRTELNLQAAGLAREKSRLAAEMTRLARILVARARA